MRISLVLVGFGFRVPQNPEMNPKVARGYADFNLFLDLWYRWAEDPYLFPKFRNPPT
jgi:hypothetical protein